MTERRFHAVDTQYPPPTPPTPPTGSASNGKGNSVGERLARLETRIEYLATKEDVSKLETLIEKKLNWILYGMVGILVTSLVGLMTALIRLW